MRKCFWAILSVLLLLVSVPVFAVFDTSHHDLRTYSSSPNSMSCANCHGRPVPASVPAAVVADGGSVGALCLGRCHSLTGIITTDIGDLVPKAPGYFSDNTGAWVAGANDYRAVLMGTSAGGGSHGRDKAIAGTNRSNVFPYDGSGTTTPLECTSCHAVHDDTNAPFIWRPLFTAPANHTGTTAPSPSATTTGLCDTCHSDKADLGGAVLSTNGRSPGGNHPVDFVVTSGTVVRNIAGTVNTLNTGRHTRLINIDFAAYGSNHVWDVIAPSVATMRSAGSPAKAWATGGKMANGADYLAFTSGTSVMGCATCHSAHRTPGADGLDKLVNEKFLSGSYGYNPICVGCHGSVDAWITDRGTWNVGGTAFGHPVGDNTTSTTGVAPIPANTRAYLTSVGGFVFNVFNGTGANTWQAGPSGQILCSSCHDIHNGVAGSLAIRDIGQGVGAVVCKSCHNGVGFPNIADITAPTPGAGEPVNAHHRTRGVFTAGTSVAVSGEGPLAIANPTWNGKYALGQGDFASGMDCADCHVFNGTAHNW